MQTFFLLFAAVLPEIVYCASQNVSSPELEKVHSYFSDPEAQIGNEISGKALLVL